jgi:hypothetical protein
MIIWCKDNMAMTGERHSLATTDIFDSPQEFTRLYVHAIFLIMFGSLLERLANGLAFSLGT